MSVCALDPRLRSVARALRKRETLAERRLWRELRHLRRHGYHFRRQAPLTGYVVDFACLSHRLIVEVDGTQHLEPAVLAADSARDAELRWRGYRVLRFTNTDIRDHLDGVTLDVLAALGAVDKPE